MESGQKLAMSATDQNGNFIANTSLTWSSSNPTVASVVPTSIATVTGAQGTPFGPGTVCAGTWNTTTVVVGGITLNPYTVCTPVPLTSVPATATITATLGALTGSAPVSVHLHVDSVTITASPVTGQQTTPPADIANCISQGATAPANTFNYKAQAFSGTTDITSTVGQFTWTVIPATVATTTIVDNTTVTLTAQAPGQAAVHASVGTTTGGPEVFTTCPVGSIAVTPATITANPGTANVLTATVTDIQGKPLTNPVPPITWSSSQPASVIVTSGTTTSTYTAISGGNSSIVASCTSPSCNVNLPSGSGLNSGYPVFSNLAPASITSTSTPETTIYAGSSPSAGGSASLVAIDTVSSSQTTIPLPAVPNSMVMSAAGSKLYMGSNGPVGMMILDTATNTVTQVSTCGTTTCAGKVLAVSPDGATALISNSSVVPSGSVVFAITGLPSAPVVQPPLAISNAVRATFSPDSSKAFVVTSDKTVFAVQTAPFAAAPVSLTNNDVNDAAFLAQGSFVFLAGGGAATPSIDVLNTCDNASRAVLTTDTTATPIAATPLLISSLPNAAQVIAADTTNFYFTSVATDGAIPPPPFTSCSPNLTLTPAAPEVNAVALGGAPIQIVTTPDSKAAFLITNTGVPNTGLFRYDVSAGTVTPVSLSTYGSPLAGAATLDSRSVYVGTAGSKVVQINAATGSLGSLNVALMFVPDLIAVRPR